MSPRERFFKLDAEVQERILTVAREEFARDGFQGASYNRIIEKTGLSKGTIYYYFDDKADLFLTVCEQAMAGFITAIGGMAAGELPTDGFWIEVERIVGEGLLFVARDPEVAGLARAAMQLNPDMLSSRRVLDFYAEMAAGFGGALALGQTLGEVRDDVPLSLLTPLLFAMGEAMDRWALEHLALGELDDEHIEQAVGMYLDLFQRVAAPLKEDR